MIKIILCSVVIVFLLGVIAVLLFKQLDNAVEIDDLKSQIHLQQREFLFMQRITNEALSSCSMTVKNFEGLAESELNRVQVMWKNETALVGGFKIARQGSCILKIENIAFVHT
jgi:hypothetical protein